MERTGFYEDFFFSFLFFFRLTIIPSCIYKYSRRTASMQTRSSSYVTENPWGSQEASPTDAISLTSNRGGGGIATSGQQAPLPRLFLKDGRLPASASHPDCTWSCWVTASMTPVCAPSERCVQRWSCKRSQWSVTGVHTARSMDFTSIFLIEALSVAATFYSPKLK